MNEGLPMWVIYEHPTDAPDHFVVRRWVVNGGVIYMDRTASLAPDLAGARAMIPLGLVKLPAGSHGRDDPAIREVWL